MLYLGAERPIIAAPRLGPLAAARIDHAQAPTALRDQASVCRLGARLAHAPSALEDAGVAEADPAPSAPPRADAERLGCACVFRDTDARDCLAAYDALRGIVGGLLAGPRDAAALLGCWSGDEALAPAVEMTVSVDELAQEIEFFSDVIHGWPILLRVTAPTAARRAVAAGDR